MSRALADSQRLTPLRPPILESGVERGSSAPLGATPIPYRTQPDWSDGSHSLAFSAEIRRQRLLFYLILNAYWEPLRFELPPPRHGSARWWRLWIDTALKPPHEIVEWRSAPFLHAESYRAGPQSVVVLFADTAKAGAPPKP